MHTPKTLENFVKAVSTLEISLFSSFGHETKIINENESLLVLHMTQHQILGRIAMFDIPMYHHYFGLFHHNRHISRIHQTLVVSSYI